MTTTLVRPPGPGSVRDRESETRPDGEDLESGSRWSVEIALAVLTLAGLLGFHRVFAGWSWGVPVLGSALAVQLVCRLTRRFIDHPLLAGLIDLASVGALTAWTVVPSSTTFGVPLLGTWRTVHSLLAGVTERMQTATVPTRPVTGFVLLAVLGAGIISLAGSWIVFRLGRVLVTAVPSVAAFVTCCSLGTRAGRDWSIALEIIAIATFVVVAGVQSRPRGGWFASERDGAARDGLAAWAPAVVLATLAAFVVVATLPAADGHGLLGWRSVGSGVDRRVPSPLVSLATRLMPQESGIHVFTVDSAVPSYWRLTSLDEFDGNSWSARDSYEGVDHKLPGLIDAPPHTRVVEEHIDIQDLASVWLPLAFAPRTVTGAGSVSYDSQSDSLITPSQTSDGLDYAVTSLEYLQTLDPTDLRAAPPLPPKPSAQTTPYEELPASVSPRVRALARQITARATTEYGRALALQNYFHGPLFTYSLHPKSDGTGNDALDTFLFVTRSGYCQQFAGSYAVLARAIGLPTRLAVGFTTGQSLGGGRYQVTDGDYHTWPEVWFPRYGWVPFEPTKGRPGQGFVIPGAERYTGDTRQPTTGGGHPMPEPVTTPTTGPKTTVTAPPTSVPAPTTNRGLNTHTHQPGGSGVVIHDKAPAAHHRAHRPVHRHVLAVIGLLAAAAAMWIALNLVGRRLRWSRRRRVGARAGGADRYGAEPIVALWDEVTERLAWRGVRRRGSETPGQFASRVSDDRRRNGDIPLDGHLVRLAEILTVAEFSGHGVTAADLVEARADSEWIARALRRDRNRSERLRLLFDPRVAWAPVTVGPLGSVRAARG